MVSFVEKTLRSKAADVQRAEANRLANLHADHVCQQEVTEKCLRGMCEGGGRSRKSSTSWSDLVDDFVAGQETLMLRRSLVPQKQVAALALGQHAAVAAIATPSVPALVANGIRDPYDLVRLPGAGHSRRPATAGDARYRF
jgi:hypothetical protein